MSTKKIIALLMAVVMVAAFSVVAYAASGEGYFGGSEAPDDFDDEDYYEDEDEPVYEEEQTTTQNPVVPPLQGGSSNQPSSSTGLSNRTVKALNDKREKNSEDTTKVIRSYGLSSQATKSLIAKHNDAAKGQGNREKDERYKKILKANPKDYLAAYRLAQVNAAMGRNGQALNWVNQCLKIFPNYQPARSLRKKLGGK